MEGETGLSRWVICQNAGEMNQPVWLHSGAQYDMRYFQRISGLVVEYIVAIDVTRVRFPADAFRTNWFHTLRKRTGHLPTAESVDVASIPVGPDFPYIMENRSYASMVAVHSRTNVECSLLESHR